MWVSILYSTVHVLCTVPEPYSVMFCLTYCCLTDGYTLVEIEITIENLNLKREIGHGTKSWNISQVDFSGGLPCPVTPFCAMQHG